MIRRAQILLAVLLGALALTTPALLIGHPDVFPDTSAYDLVGQWFAEQAGLIFPNGFGVIHHRRDLSYFFSMAGARSPTYGTLLFLTTVRGSAWAMVGLQGLCASSLIALTLRVTLRRFSLAAFAAVTALLTLVSSLPFFVSFLMPDVFMGMGALAATLMLFFFDRLSWPERWVLGAFTALTLTFHATNAPAVAVLCVCATAAALLRGLPWPVARGGLAAAAAAVACVVLVNQLYPAIVRERAHAQLSHPPFLSARMLADGPARVYLRLSCKRGTRWTWCPYVDRPLNDPNDILWGVSRAKGVYEPAPLNVRLQMTREEPRFVAAAFQAFPGITLFRLIQDAVIETGRIDVIDTIGYHDRNLVAKGPKFDPPIPALRFCSRGRDGYCYVTPAQATSQGLVIAGMVVAALYLLARLAATAVAGCVDLRLAPLSPRLAAASAAVVLMLLANSALCGMISGIYPRYVMRADWLAPLLALVALIEARQRPASWSAPRAAESAEREASPAPQAAAAVV